MKGNLKDFSPTQILSLVSLAKKTGALSVQRKEGPARLCFREGRLVYAAIGEADGSLTSILVRAKRIPAEQAPALSRYAQKSSDQQLGLLLIQKKLITQDEIVQHIKRHALASLNEFASWKEGAFAFEPDAQPENGRIIVAIDLENVIIQIARMQKLDEQLEEEIPSLDIALKFVNRPGVKLSDLQLSRDEWRVLQYVKPENTIRMIASKLNLSDRQIRRVVGSLREAGLVELTHVQRREVLTPEERQQKRQIVSRLITRIQSIGAESG